jgi:hypothetical protein
MSQFFAVLWLLAALAWLATVGVFWFGFVAMFAMDAVDRLGYIMRYPREWQSQVGELIADITAVAFFGMLPIASIILLAVR